MSDASIVVPPPPPASYKNRRGWLIAFGIFEILIGCVLLLMIGLIAFTLRQAPANPAVPPPPPGAITAMAAVYGVIAVFFVAVGIGSIQLRRWARIAMLIVGWGWLAIGVLATIMMSFMMPAIMNNVEQQSSSPLPPSAQAIARIVMFVTLGVFFILLPLVFVLFYGGKNVKATCENASGTGASRTGKPVSVIVVTTWFALGAISIVAILFVRPELPFFGILLSGWGARLASVVMSAVSAWLACNLYWQRRMAWRVAVAWTAFHWLSMLVTLSRLSLVEMYGRMGYSAAEIARIMPFANYGIYMGWATGVAFFVFLLAIRKQFSEPTALPA